MKKEKLTHKLYAKIAAYVILALSVPTLIATAICVSVAWDEGFYDPDAGYRLINFAYTTVFNLRYVSLVVFAIAAFAAVFAFIFLMCAAGRREGHEEPVRGYLYPIPFDLLTVCWGVVAILPFGVAGELICFSLPMFAIGVLLVDAGVLLATAWCAQLAMRIKCGGWAQNMIVRRVAAFCLRILREIGSAIASLIKGIPLVPKTTLIVLVFFFVEFLTQMAYLHDKDMRVLWWLILHLIAGCVLIYVALQLRRLQKGVAALAEGDLSYQIETERMAPVFRAYAESLNHIADGMQRAVAEQTKSERMKTELITNVSHDIKTPLTSIVNYVGLLKAPHDEAQEKEYIDALDRQSRRLKKLTEDLVEASKASSGALEVDRRRHSLNELLRQSAGEYQERLEAIPLETVLSIPKSDIFALVDGKLMWRALDNLFSNVCKYAQPGTRVYAEIASADGRATIRMKNISKEPLNISADELTERFVRGDAARSGEGSGLGLHIAQSLTELMGGLFRVTVDGDLFKAEMTFATA